MSESLIKDFYRKIHLDDLTLAYSGNFSDSMTEKIIELSESYLESHEKLSKLKKRTSFLVAESFQNVVRHSIKLTEDADEDGLNETFLLRFYDNKCFIASENLIENKYISVVESQLEQIRNLDTAKLKELYKAILSEGSFSEKGGAGLGLVEMARKTGNKLMHAFEPKSHGKSLFYLMLVLENREDWEKVSDYTADFEKIMSIIKNVQLDNMYLLYKGDYEKDILDRIEQILERNLDFQDEALSSKVRLYHAALITMNKIGEYSHDPDEGTDGMLFFGKDEKGYLINATFPLSSHKKEGLNKILSRIKAMSKEELDQRYNELIKEQNETGSHSVDLSFIQLARIVTSWGYEIENPEGIRDELIYQVHI
ncbi:SiaB family protein kinase [Bacteroidota bacterium]